MPSFVIPDSFGADLVEVNFCHSPSGPGGGQFCSTGHSAGRVPEGSAKIPPFLKDDVRRARAAGILTFHAQQPEPVKDLSGRVHDPIAKSHAEHGSKEYTDVKGFTQHASGGRIFITTRGGDFEPERTEWLDKYGFNTRRVKKDLTPADLKHPATPEDIISTFRHEMGHLLRKEFRGTAKTPRELASELSAWQYAVEIAPDHKISIPMAARGLLSHAYTVFRAETLRKNELKRVSSWDFADAANRWLQMDSKRGFVDPEAMRQAKAFTKRAVTALRNYGAVLTKRGLWRVPDQSPSAAAFRQKIKSVGAGSTGLL